MVALFNPERVAFGKDPIRIGIGIGSGEVVAEYTGTQQRPGGGGRAFSWTSIWRCVVDWQQAYP